MVSTHLFLTILQHLMTIQGSLLETDHFKVQFPAKSQYQVIQVEIAGEPVPLHLHTLEQGDLFFLVSQGEYPLAVNVENTEVLFDGVANGIASNYGGILIRQVDATIPSADFSRRIVIQLPDGNFIHAAMYLRGRILYQQIAKSLEPEVRPGPYETFFSSFTIK